MGLDVEYLMLSQRPPKSAPLCSMAAAAPAASLNVIMAMMEYKEMDVEMITQK